jgi:hypothetical protein
VGTYAGYESRGRSIGSRDLRAVDNSRAGDGLSTQNGTVAFVTTHGSVLPEAQGGITGGKNINQDKTAKKGVSEFESTQGKPP